MVADAILGKTGWFCILHGWVSCTFVLKKWRHSIQGAMKTCTALGIGRGEAGTLLPGRLHDRTRDATTGRLACNQNGSMGTLRCFVATWRWMAFSIFQCFQHSAWQIDASTFEWVVAECEKTWSTTNVGSWKSSEERQLQGLFLSWSGHYQSVDLALLWRCRWGGEPWGHIFKSANPR